MTSNTWARTAGNEFSPSFSRKIVAHMLRRTHHVWRHTVLQSQMSRLLISHSSLSRPRNIFQRRVRKRISFAERSETPCATPAMLKAARRASHMRNIIKKVEVEVGWDWVWQSASHLGTPPVVPPIMSAQGQPASSSFRPQEEAILEWERNGQTKFQKRDGVGPPVPRIERTASRSNPTLANPTLAKPTLANVKVLVVCKDFGFSELIVWVF